MSGQNLLMSVNNIISRRTVNVDIPDCIANRRIPIEVKYELENFYQYLVKKYRL